MRTRDSLERGSLLDLLGSGDIATLPPPRSEASILNLLGQASVTPAPSETIPVSQPAPVAPSPQPTPSARGALDQLERALEEARRSSGAKQGIVEPAAEPKPRAKRKPVLREADPAAIHIGSALSPAAMLRRLISKWYWIAAGGLAGAAIVALYSLTLPDEYQSIARIVLEPRGITPIRDSVSPQGLNSEATIAYSQSQVDIIRSLSVLNPVVEIEDLTNDPEFTSKDGLLSRLGLDGIAALLPRGTDETDRNDVIGQMQRQLYVGRLNQSFVIEIGFTSQDPFKAARITNAITRSYIASESGAQSDAAEKASADLTGSLAAMQARVKASEERIEAHKREFGLVETNGRLVDEDSLARLNDQLAAATAATAEARSQVALSQSIDVNDVVGGGLPSGLQTQAMAQARLQYQRARSALSRLSVKLGERHPQLREAAAELTAAEGNITSELKRIAAANERELARAQSREGDLRKSVTDLRERALESNAPKAQLRELERQLEANRRVYESFLQRSRETGGQTAIASRNARIISEAVAPSKKSGPQRTVMTVAGGIAGSAAAALLLLMPTFLRAGTAFQRGAPPAPIAPVRPMDARRREDDLYGDAVRPTSAPKPPDPEFVAAVPVEEAPKKRERPAKRKRKRKKAKTERVPAPVTEPIVTPNPSPSEPESPVEPSEPAITAASERLRLERDLLAAALEKAQEEQRTLAAKAEEQRSKAWEDGLAVARREAEIIENARRRADELRRSMEWEAAMPRRAVPHHDAPVPYGYAPPSWRHVPSDAANGDP